LNYVPYRTVLTFRAVHVPDVPPAQSLAHAQLQLVDVALGSGCWNAEIPAGTHFNLIRSGQLNRIEIAKGIGTRNGRAAGFNRGMITATRGQRRQWQHHHRFDRRQHGRRPGPDGEGR